MLITGSSILNDTIFTQYGGHTGTSTPMDRAIAYQIAEQKAIEEIGTFLVPTTITGTYDWPHSGYRMKLPQTMVSSINAVTGLFEIACGCQNVEISGCAKLVDSDNGVIDIRQCNCSCPCALTQGIISFPNQVRIVYTAGWPTGVVSSSASSLRGLVIVAQMELDQILCPECVEGGVGEAGIESYSDSGYSEKRVGLKMTSFGMSSRANYAARLLKPLKYFGAMRIR